MKTLLFSMICVLGFWHLPGRASPCGEAVLGDSGRVAGVFRVYLEKIQVKHYQKKKAIEEGFEKVLRERSEEEKELAIRHLEGLLQDPRLQRNEPVFVKALNVLLQNEGSSKPSSVNEYRWGYALRWVINKTLETFAVIETLRTSLPPSKEDREIVFLEDRQLTYKRPILFATNFPGDLKQLQAITANGMYSQKFSAFRSRLESAGYNVEIIEKFPVEAPIPEGYEIVRGAVGRY